MKPDIPVYKNHKEVEVNPALAAFIERKRHEYFLEKQSDFRLVYEHYRHMWE
jgi:hypothetical protein